MSRLCLDSGLIFQFHCSSKLPSFILEYSLSTSEGKLRFDNASSRDILPKVKGEAWRSSKAFPAGGILRHSQEWQQLTRITSAWEIFDAHHGTAAFSGTLEQSAFREKGLVDRDGPWDS